MERNILEIKERHAGCDRLKIQKSIKRRRRYSVRVVVSLSAMRASTLHTVPVLHSRVLRFNYVRSRYLYLQFVRYSYSLV